MDGVAASERDRLPVQGFSGTPEEIERQWYEQVYRGRGDSISQLTLRAVIMGSVLGGVLSLTNLYIGLKAGWVFGGFPLFSDDLMCLAGADVTAGPGAIFRGGDYTLGARAGVFAINAANPPFIAVQPTIGFRAVQPLR
jgi:hypothetical protein